MPFPRKALIASALVLGAFLLWKLGYVLLLVFAAILFGVLLRGLANLLSERTGIGPNASLAIVIVVLVATAVGSGFLMAPRIAAQLADMQEALPQSWDRLRSYLGTLPFGSTIVNSGAEDLLENEAVRSRIPRVFSVTLSGIVQFAFVLVTGIYLAAKPQAYVQGVLKLLPHYRRDRACEVLGAVGYTLQWWLIGQLLIMVFVGAGCAIGLALIGVPLALTLGIIAGLLDFIPNVGPFLAAAPALLIAFLAGPEKAIYVALLYIVLQQLEGYVLSPLVHRRTVSLEPALIITAQLAFGLTTGALGLLLATPLVAVALVAIKMLYVEDVLGDRMEVEGAHELNKICQTDVSSR